MSIGISINYFIWKKYNDYKICNKLIAIIVSVYTFIISNIYILDIFSWLFGEFTLTIYWGLIGSLLLFYGISKDVIKFRTIGLYFIALTSVKVFLYDVWSGIDDTSSRIAILLVLGIIFIIISTLYTKKYGNNILGELALDNLKDDERNPTKDNAEEMQTSNIITKKDSNNKVKVSESNDFMKKLEKINIDRIKVVRFTPKTSPKFTIRSSNLMRLSKLVTSQLGKSTFTAGELSEIYNYVTKNYKTKLSRREYDKLRTTLKGFIDEGGEVEIVKK